MDLEKKLDKILDNLYDANLLHWKEIPSTDFVGDIFRQNFKLNWADREINLILTILLSEGYIVLNKKDPDRQVSSYTLTPKGVLMKHKGGFAKTKRLECWKQFLIYFGSIAAIIVTILTVWDFIENRVSSHKEVEQNSNYYCPHQNGKNHIFEDNKVNIIPPVRTDTIRK